jgi:hypothetical protein
VLLFIASPARAGLYYSAEVIAELPAQWRGFLPDHRTLRTLAAPPTVANPLRERYKADRDRLAKLAGERPLSADESADLGALQIRLGNVTDALTVLRAAHARFPDHFHLAANLGTAWQLNGDLDQAALALRHAVALAPPKLRKAEDLHFRLVTLRRSQPRGTQSLDDLFGVRYVGEDGTYSPGQIAAAERPKVPADAIAVVQQLALWLPSDGRLTWQLGELANAFGDVRTAAAILDGCVTEFGLRDPELRRHRTILRAAADELTKTPPTQAQHEKHSGVAFRSGRPLARRFDPSRLPAIRPDGLNTLPWAALTATTLDRQSRPTFPHYLRDLDGKRVMLTGYLQPLGDGPEAGVFLLIEYPVGCWFCEVPEPNGVLVIELAAGKTATFTKNQVKVTGRLVLNGTDPENYLFTIRDAAIVPPD